MKKNILINLSIIGVVAAIAIGGTVAYFSDTETSSGNTFTAGAIDLKIDNTSYYNGELNPDTTWGYEDSIGLFFNFHDLKPGDWGEDTISVHVDNNDTWACMDFNLYNADDNGLVEPEEVAGDTTGGDGRGELQDQIHFVWWADDGDNVLEKGERVFQGVISLADLNGFSVPLADASGNGVLNSGPLVGGQDYYIGKTWCFGDITINPLDNTSNEGPDVRGSGINCSAQGTDNITQSDSVQGTLSFRAIQSRNNNGFACKSPCSIVSFLAEDGFVGVDDSTSTWSTNNSMVNLGKNALSLLGDTAHLYGYKSDGSPYNLTQRGTRGLGVGTGEPDEIDDPEKIEIVFDEPILINEFQVRSLFTNENGGDEEGDIDLYNGTTLVKSYHLSGAEAGGNGVLNTIGSDQAIDKIVFYVAPGQSYTSYSEFAVSKLRVCPAK